MDSTQGAPKRTESSKQSIFSERPLEVSGLGGVASVSRLFEQYRVKPQDPAKTMGGRPFDGLAVALRPKLGDQTQLVSLTQGRLLTEYESDVLSRQLFVPQLASILPQQAVRVGDPWRISKKAAQAMLGDPALQADNLIAKLAEIRKEIDGPRMVASITIGGRASGPTGDTNINAEVLFTFLPESSVKAAPTKPASPLRATEELTESRGAITELRLASVTSGPQPGPGRLRFQTNREVTMHRQLGLVAGAVAPPKLDKFPDLTESNAWLVHLDASGRYSFEHPQDLLRPERGQPTPEANTSLLVRTRRDVRDMLQVEFFAKILTPEDVKKELAEKYKLLKMEVIKGDEVWLPEVEWPRMRVHRIEGAVKMADPKSGPMSDSTRIHFDGYLILFGQTASIIAISSTSREVVAPYRREVEQILKTIQLDPPRPAVD